MSDRNKRPLPAEDSNNDSPGKRARTSGNSAPSFLPPKDDLVVKPPSGNDLVAQQIAKKQAEIKAKFAAFSAKKAPEPAKASKPAEVARPDVSEIARRVAEAKKKVEDMAARQKNANPYMAAAASKSAQAAASKSKASDAALASMMRPGTTLHPLLANLDKPSAPSTSKDRYKPMLPKFASTKANARVVAAQPVKKPEVLQISSGPTLEEARQNPYFDRRLGVESLQPRNKKPRQMKFNTKGKFVRIADQLRQEAKMEALKQRILEAAKKAGLEDEMEADGGLGRRVKRAAPPAVEWWDAPLIKGDSYEDLQVAEAKLIWEQGCSSLVQHPIPIPAPGDKKAVAPKALMLTKKEQKKMRRQRRMAELKDHQDRVRMGLLPPDAPKVRLTNMMRVLTQEAIADPTKIEAKVRREMTVRKSGHEKMNSERALTDEQRKAKIEEKARDEEKKGIYAAAFRIKSLSNPLHKIKVRRNAEQLFLAGITLFHPKFALVLVEGSFHSIKKYKRLMQHRIDWTEETTVIRTTENDEETGEPVEAENISLVDNRCDLVWEGEHREHLFRGFRAKNTPTDHLAREALGPKVEGIFDSARKFDELQ